MKSGDRASIIALDRFIQATRDSGYKGTTSAVCELVDNALQASAKRISVRIDRVEEIEEFPIMISVLDDGHGMDVKTLRQALRFGGSTRFDDRSGLGRYGMGLPNSSLSQARRVEVFSWTEARKPYYSYLDVDEIASGEMTSVPLPQRVALAELGERVDSDTGTLVVWTWCDKLDNRRISTLEQKLRLALGRVFRYFMWSGIVIEVNGESVVPVDPLYLRDPSARTGGRLFGEPLIYEVRAPSGGARNGIGEVVVTFSELPVHQWHNLSNEEKRRLGVTNGSGVSVVRGGREVDYGWFFLSGKRRENYDDWWRAEVRFDPILDELFGITHTKQEIRPHESILEILGDDMAEMARALNVRVRHAHTALKTTKQTRTAEEIAEARDGRLREIPRKRPRSEELSVIDRLPLRSRQGRREGARPYSIVESDLGESVFFRPILQGEEIVLALNPRHAFYKRLYKPLLEGESLSPLDMSLLLQLLLLAASRAELAVATTAEMRAVARFREEWSAVLEQLYKP